MWLYVLIVVGLILMIAPPSIKIDWSTADFGPGRAAQAEPIATRHHVAEIELPIKFGRNLPGFTTPESTSMRPASHSLRAPAPYRAPQPRGTATAPHALRMIMPDHPRIARCIRERAHSLWHQGVRRHYGAACVGSGRFIPMLGCEAICSDGIVRGVSYDLAPILR